MDIYFILIISVLGPVIGSLIGIIKKPSQLFMFNMLSFAAGVMLSISFIQLIPESINISSVWICSLGILVGAGVMYAMDRMIPHIHPRMCKQEHGCNLKQTALYLMLGMFLHNFPEGMAMAAGGVVSYGASLSIALAIAVHNIPEGICTSAPYYATSGKRLKAFLLSSATALPIIFGFLFARLLFSYITPIFIGFVISATAGLMIYISADELIPVSCNKSNGCWNHSMIFSLILGVIFVVALGQI